jgi:hypothetical protein
MIFTDRGITLKTYKDAKQDIGEFHCLGHEIPDDTTIVYESYDETTEETGNIDAEHEIVTLWLCKSYVFCKCGQLHPIYSDEPIEDQLRDIIWDVHFQTGVYFGIPIENPPDGFKIVPVVQIERVPQKIDNLNTWY